MQTLIPLAAIVLLAGGVASTAQAQAREEAKLIVATSVVEDIKGTKDESVPQWLLDRAYGVVVIPDAWKGAFWFGARGGSGVMVARRADGTFSDPVFVSLGGISFGFQFGAQSTDIVLIFTTEKGIQKIADGKVTLGGDASVAAGPMGRSASAATDASFTAEVYSYSRSKGLFAGIALDGSALTIDNDSNAAFYGRKVTAEEIINGTVRTNSPTAQRFVAAVTSNTAVPAATPAKASEPAEPAPATAASSDGTAPPGTVKTYPLDPNQPGTAPSK
jgi:lipid-binding SYLF domain-containing protein